VAIDCETTGLHPTTAGLTHVAFATSSRRSGFVHATEDTLVRLPLALDGRALVMHNAIYDLVVLARHGVSLLHAPVDCTRVLSYLVNEHGAHDLKTATQRTLGHRGILGFREIPSAESIGAEAHARLMAGKGRVDCEETLEVFEALAAYAQERPMLWGAYLNIERPLVPVLASMTLVGVPTDVAHLEAYAVDLERARNRTHETIERWAGYRLDPDNDEAVAAWLYGTLGLPAAARTATGQTSVSRAALASLSHPAVELVATARAERSKLSAVRRWLDAVVAGRTHPTYSAWSRPTGTITVSQPFGGTEAAAEETQLLPTRHYVVAPEGKTLVILRLRGARLRWLAHLSRDPLLVRALDEGRPPEDLVAAWMGISDAAGRAAIAAWLEALCAGHGPRAVARTAGCQQKEAQALGKQLREALPGVFRLKAHLEEAGRSRGWVQTPLGRRRRFQPRYTAREALSEVLGTAESDTFKLGLRRLWDLVGPSLVLAAETTVILEADLAEVKELSDEAHLMMTRLRGDLPWPFTVDIRVAPRWSDVCTGGIG
jgi:DNA polymerase-1